MKYQYYYLYKYSNDEGTYYKSGEGNSVQEIAEDIEKESIIILELSINRYRESGVKVISDIYTDDRCK